MPKLRQDTPFIVPGRNRSAAIVPPHRFVKTDPGNGPDAVQLAAAATDIIQGVSLENIPIGSNGDIAKNTGLVILEIGAAVAAEGIKLTSDGTGRAIPVSADLQAVGAISETTGGNAGDLIEATLVAPGQQHGV